MLAFFFCEESHDIINSDLVNGLFNLCEPTINDNELIQIQNRQAKWENNLFYNYPANYQSKYFPFWVYLA